jgi:DNA mismatch repair ATPase MutS
LSHLARNGTGSPGAGVPRCLVIAATHDLELVTRLDHSFRAFHFGDRIAEDRLQFDYRLHPGVATSRNAVALLRLLGAPEAVVLDAMERAGRESPASGPDPAYSRPVR